jgi:hypothetical protein
MESVMVPPGMGIVEEVDCALILCQMWVVLPVLPFAGTAVVNSCFIFASLARTACKGLRAVLANSLPRRAAGGDKDILA